MKDHKLLLNDVSRNNIDDLDERNNTNPAIEPNGNVQNRNQLEQTNDNKDEIRDGIQFGAKLADCIRFSSDPTIGNIGKSSGDV